MCFRLWGFLWGGGVRVDDYEKCLCYYVKNMNNF